MRGDLRLFWRAAGQAIARTGLIVLAILLIMAPADAIASKRVALMIANGAYAHTPALKNPPKDVAAIAEKLRALGFKVRLEANLNARRFAEVLQEFANSLDADTDALFYYAGHGVQFRGENMLVGVDARLNGEATLPFETYRLNSVISALEGRASTVLLFWDACRNNPLAEQLVRSIGPAASRNPSLLTRSGAAPVPERGGDTLIVFSAEPGKEALDGSGALSPFAESLGRHIATSNIEIEVMLKRVTAEVLANTKQFQKPERLSKLTREFYFSREAVADAAAEAELKKLRAQLEQLRREAAAPAPRRFRIVGADDPSFGKAPAVTAARQPPVLTRSGTPSKAAAPAPRTTGAIEPATSGGPAAGANVLIAVDQKASSIVRRLRVSPDGKLLAVGDDEGGVRIVRLETFEVLRTLRAHSQRVSDVDFSPDSRTLLSAGREGVIRYWDIETGRQIRELQAPGAIGYSARMNPSAPDRWVLMGDRAGFLRAWDLRKNTLITNVKMHDGPVLSVGYQPGGGGAYFSAGGDGSLKVRMPMGQRYSVAAHQGSIFQASYSSSGKLLYSVGQDRKAKIWETSKLQSQQPRSVLEGHLRYVLTADMSLDETLLATGGADKAVNIWDLSSDKLAARLQGHTSDIESVAFSPNGKFVVSASEDKSVRIWSIEGREELVRLFFQKGGEKYAGVTVDNQYFGDRNSGLLSVYVDGRRAADDEAEKVVQYLGKGIAILEAAH
jgi:WD40 repeat protein